LHVYSRGVEGGEAPSSDGRRNWAWSYRNQQIAKPESGAVSSREYGPLIVATTFKDYGALAAAYNARAKAKSEPTSRISKLANDLTQNAHTSRDQARALYDWVSHNIKFAGNCVGVGAVVPHDADAVLANRMGDCKDHTALLQALLAAKGVASTPVLISSGSAFTLPEAPCIEAFNHVISYIPSLDLYADSTSEYTPFGSLPVSDAGKPVIHTANFTGIQHTPTANWKDNGWHSSTVMNIHPDGSADGETEVDATGRYAERIRYGMTYLQPNIEDSLVRRDLAANGFTGTGILIKGDPKELTDSYRYGSKYKISDAMNLPGPGAMYVRSPLERAGSVAGVGADEPDRTVDFSCGGEYSKQEFTIHLPNDVKVHAMPRNVELRGKYQSYKATYQLKGNTITAVREFEDHTPGPVCAPAVAVEYRRFAIGVRKDLRAQVLYE
jgi:Transglutaminase-like superfamily